MLDVFSVPVVAEVAVHLYLHQEVPDGGGRELEGPGEDPHGAGYQEEEVPEPENGKHLVIDDVEREDTQRVDSFLLASFAKPYMKIN